MFLDHLLMYSTHGEGCCLQFKAPLHGNTVSTALLDGKTGEDAPEDPEQLAQPHRAQGVAGSWHSPRDLWA